MIPDAGYLIVGFAHAKCFLYNTSAQWFGPDVTCKRIVILISIIILMTMTMLVKVTMLVTMMILMTVTLLLTVTILMTVMILVIVMTGTMTFIVPSGSSSP